MEKVRNNAPISIYNKLLYHNQSIIGPIFIEELTSWKRLTINSSLRLTVHPDLNTYQAISEDKSITLIGFILDPENPQATDSDIVDGLIHKFSDCDSFFVHTYDLGGRWILIVSDGKEIRLFNDAAGLRQVFYADPRYTKDLWCASQPGIIAEILALQMDKDAVGFINSYEFRTHKEFRWPGYSSPYGEIRHMLPNHYLNLKTGECHRYWPDKPLQNLPLDEAVESISSVLHGFIKGASHRFDLAVSLTAGLDSRLVLAASKDICNTIPYMTVRQIDKPDDYADVVVPSMLLAQLGLKHDIVKSSLILKEEFVTVFRKNVPLSHYIYAPDAQAILDYYGQKKVVVTGSVSEIGRCSFGSLRNKAATSYESEVTADDLARVQRMGKNRFAINAFEDWLSGLGNVYNVPLPDMFEWEQGHGNWLAMCQLEFDIAWKDLFTPFNCRSLLITMLSVDEDYRSAPDYHLFEQLIVSLWPEVLSVPINPHIKKQGTLSSLAKRYVPAPLKKGLKKILRMRG